MNIFIRSFFVLSWIAGSLGSIPASYAGNRPAVDAVPDAVEFAVLKSLYDDLQGGSWTNKTNWPATGSWPSSASSAQFGTWFGVTVANGDIIAITLSTNKLQGVLPANLGELIKLTSLNLSENQLSGTIPSSIGSLTELESLRLNSNKFTGSIPATIGTLSKLTLLSLSRNQLTGSVPNSLGNLTNLTTLSVSENQLSGNIPTSIGDLVKLQTLSAFTNRFTGNIPSSIGRLVKLQTINLSNNQLTGNIPSSCGALTLATFLNLGKNQLSGPIPPELGAMVAISELYLHENKLTGSLPASLKNLSKLRTLFLHTNQLSGTVPPELASLARMEDFYIHNNRLEGPLPSTLFSTWINLSLVDVSNNQFTGQFPSILGKNKLVRIVADLNAFDQLPDDILELPVLTSISMKANELRTIPLFCNQVNKGNLAVAMENNRLDFSSLQTLTCVGLKAATFTPQRPISDVASINAVVGQPLAIPSRPQGPGTTTVYWEKQSFSGTWQSVDGQNQNASSGVFKRNAYAAADEGVYRWRMTNTVVTGLTLESAPITVKTAIRFVLDNFGFQYKYDNRRRMTHKKVPGADWVYMVYDDRDRLVMTQDGEQRKVNDWSYTKYDRHNRPIMTGIYHHASALDQAGMSALISTTRFDETYTGAVTHHGYTNNVFASVTFPPDSFDIHTVTYYDNYNFKAGWSPAFNYDSARIQPQTQAGHTYRQPRTAFERVMGQVTGMKVKTTGSDPYWLYTVNYYDDKYRLLQQVSENYKGGTDRTTTLYDFVGKVLALTTEHTVNTLTWQNLVGARVEVDNLARAATNNNWGNSGASSAQLIPANADGWMETTATSVTAFRMAGVSAQDANANYTSIDYAFYLRNRDLAIFEKTKGTSNVYVVPGGYARGDKLRIERRSGQLRFYRNGIQVYPLNGAGLPCTTPLLTDVAINTNRGTISHTRMSVTQGRPQTLAREFVYDHAGRLLKVWHTTNTAPKVLLVSNTYNELGQLVAKKLHSPDQGATFKQHEDYRYTIRGWLSRINQSDLTPEQTGDPQDFFGMNLSYNEVVPTLSNAAQFNGNISAITWNNGTGQGEAKQNGYRYSYDPMNRITGADYCQKKSDWGQPTHLDDEGDPQPSDAFSETGYEYDLNGNLQRLVRKGANGLDMDELTYRYGTDSQQSNRLLAVVEAGDRHQGFNDGNTVGDDYVYDSNGSMVADKNKGIASITYNHLNLPTKVVKTTSEYVRYIYDASGRKHSQQVYDVANSLIKRSDYTGELFYENDTLRFINHEEGRIVMNGSAPEYQYNLKDHLGNVRVTFTSKDETETATATLEDANAAIERGAFLNYDEAVTLNERMFDHTHHVPGDQGNTTFRSTRLLGGSDPAAVYGLAKSLSVMPGDMITAKVYAKYVDSNDPQVHQALRNFLISLGTGTVSGPLIDGGGPGSLGGGVFPYPNYLERENDDGTGPKAYLNYLIFDREFNYLNGGFKRLTTAGRETGNPALLPEGAGFDVMAFEEGEIKITEPGFVYLYLSNENENRVEVFFDDFEVTHVKSPVVQMDDYYPFGLTFNSYKRENSIPNMYQYNGKEKQNELDLGWLDYGARMYDASLGRWTKIDRLSEKFAALSPYAYAANNPIIYIDVNGDDIYYFDEKGKYTGYMVKDDGPNRGVYGGEEFIFGDQENDHLNLVQFKPGDKLRENGWFRVEAENGLDIDRRLDEVGVFDVNNKWDGLKKVLKSKGEGRLDMGVGMELDDAKFGTHTIISTARGKISFSVRNYGNFLLGVAFAIMTEGMVDAEKTKSLANLYDLWESNGEHKDSRDDQKAIELGGKYYEERYSNKGSTVRFSDKNYSDEFLKWYYDDEDKD
jgi:RHS repeat-associated protein